METKESTRRRRKRGIDIAALLLYVLCVTGCGKTGNDTNVILQQEKVTLKSEAPILTVDEKIALTESTMEPDYTKEEIESREVPGNQQPTLSVPTDVEKIGDTYFIVDCYHNQVIYSESLTAPLTEWKVMCDKIEKGHTIASDGEVYLIDDTENNRILIYQKEFEKFILTQTITSVGARPHYIRYDAETASFYVLSSMTGEIYILQAVDYHLEEQHTSEKGDLEQSVSENGFPERKKVVITDIKEIPSLKNTYCRSFTIVDDKILFPSSTGFIVEATFPGCIEEKVYQVPDEIAGMAQIYKIEDAYYLTISTDREVNQDKATIIRTNSLTTLQEGSYEDIYDELELDRTTPGTPYNISGFDGHYYLAEHRHTHGIFAFDVEENHIEQVQVLY